MSIGKKLVLTKILKKKQEPRCQRCKRKIEEPSYILVTGAVITNINPNIQRKPAIFTCPEQAFNYAQGILLHTTCWIETLREYGSPLFNMSEVYAQYNKQTKKKG